MSFLVLLGLSSLVLTTILTPLCRNLFIGRGVVDRPENGRKNDKRRVARVGGMAIAVSYASCFLLLLLPPFRNRVFGREQLLFILKLAPGGVLVLVTGLLDDLFNLKPWQKLMGQTAAAVWAYAAGVQITLSAGHPISSPGWSFPLTILWLVACQNAFNLIDGVDGLAAGLGLIATVTTLIAALLQNDLNLALAVVPLAGCLLGFLWFNFPPASVFLGDSGSLLIGFLLGCYGVVWGGKPASLLRMTAPLMALAVPMLDVLLSVIRRLISREPVFGADRRHIHHRLLDRGCGPRETVSILYGAAALGAVFSLLQSVSSTWYSWLNLVLFGMAAFFGVRYLNYAEFDLAGRIRLWRTAHDRPRPAVSQDLRD